MPGPPSKQLTSPIVSSTPSGRTRPSAIGRSLVSGQILQVDSFWRRLARSPSSGACERLRSVYEASCVSRYCDVGWRRVCQRRSSGESKRQATMPRSDIARSPSACARFRAGQGSFRTSKPVSRSRRMRIFHSGNGTDVQSQPAGLNRIADYGVISIRYVVMNDRIASASTMSLARKRIECESVRSKPGRYASISAGV